MKKILFLSLILFASQIIYASDEKKRKNGEKIMKRILILSLILFANQNIYSASTWQSSFAIPDIDIKKLDKVTKAQFDKCISNLKKYSDETGDSSNFDLLNSLKENLIGENYLTASGIIDENFGIGSAYFIKSCLGIG
jgi:hypothetical protein